FCFCAGRLRLLRHTIPLSSRAGARSCGPPLRGMLFLLRLLVLLFMDTDRFFDRIEFPFGQIGLLAVRLIGVLFTSLHGSSSDTSRAYILPIAPGPQSLYGNGSFRSLVICVLTGAMRLSDHVRHCRSYRLQRCRAPAVL